MTPRIPFLLGRLEQAYRVHRFWEAADPASFLSNVGQGVRVVVTNGVVGCPSDVMRALPDLGLVAVGGVGLDAVDLTQARERGIQVTTTPDVLTDDVADQALALLLAVSRQLLRGDRYVREGGWERAEELPLTSRVSGKRAGIVGLGRIGKAIAKRLVAMNMRVAYTGRHQQNDQPYRFIPDVLELAHHADVLIVSSAGGNGTRHLVGAQVLQALGPSGILINVARGSVVDESALVGALQGGRLGGAGLDVFADEPHVPVALRALDNVVLAPHAGTRTVEARREMAELVLANIEAFLAGKVLVSPISP
ncbi:lactate dehydrogenase-like oxidoreductase [Deinococcus peraridilitoris DSM 19664]|uniref:Lactate dehydrogenase-like oxidoreductase n=2 Tax=Deinococcus TaxID=1298 RepID=L0A461_DEIPD|nr:lactate dehydrogenase-like oxidoreductase [Deinococcus peraridilitoris DSM 19664]